MKSKSAKILNILAPLISIGVILIFWAVEACVIDDEMMLPTIGQTLDSFFNLFGHAAFYYALLGTLLRTLIAFLSCFIIAFSLGLLCKKFPTALKFVNPIMAVVRVLPTIAVVLLLVLWTSTRSSAAIIVTALVVLPTLFTSMLNALNSVDEKQLEMCKLFKVPYKKVLFKVQIPQILPEMLRLVGSGLSLNLKLMVAAEVLSRVGVSIGNLLERSKSGFEIPTLMALVLVTVIIGLIIELTFNLIAKLTGRWKKK